MILTIRQAVSLQERQALLDLMDQGTFTDGRETASANIAHRKNNEQLSMKTEEPKKVVEIVLHALQRRQDFLEACYPKKLHGVMASRYKVGMSYGQHIDAALMGKGVRNRTDISMTLFLSKPEDYDGGELAMETGGAQQLFKLDAGDLLCYPTSQLHQVMEVTRGERRAVVGWVESYIRDDRAREILWDLSQARKAVYAAQGECRALELVNKAHTNLLRRWAET